uniref:Uncharacterized protein n=1 Tax=Romanomermis culicivorax TaxID=13658 RepID=A0A915J9B8_ROMCU
MQSLSVGPVQPPRHSLWQQLIDRKIFEHWAKSLIAPYDLQVWQRNTPQFVLKNQNVQICQRSTLHPCLLTCSMLDKKSKSFSHAFKWLISKFPCKVVQFSYIRLSRLTRGGGLKEIE